MEVDDDAGSFLTTRDVLGFSTRGGRLASRRGACRAIRDADIISLDSPSHGRDGRSVATTPPVSRHEHQEVTLTAIGPRTPNSSRDAAFLPRAENIKKYCLNNYIYGDFPLFRLHKRISGRVLDRTREIGENRVVSLGDWGHSPLPAECIGRRCVPDHPKLDRRDSILRDLLSPLPRSPSHPHR